MTREVTLRPLWELDIIEKIGKFGEMSIKKKRTKDGERDRHPHGVGDKLGQPNVIKLEQVQEERT